MRLFLAGILLTGVFCSLGDIVFSVTDSVADNVVNTATDTDVTATDQQSSDSLQSDSESIPLVDPTTIIVVAGTTGQGK
jgi:hypothetical protein